MPSYESRNTKKHLFCFRLKSCELLCNIQLWQVWWWKAAVWSSDTAKLFSSRKKKRQEEQWVNAQQLQFILTVLMSWSRIWHKQPPQYSSNDWPRLMWFPLLSFNTSYTLLAPSHIQISWIFQETLKETDAALHADGLCASSLFTHSLLNQDFQENCTMFFFFFLSYRLTNCPEKSWWKEKKFFRVLYVLLYL